ncbi:glycohydrolase [Mycobacterium phage Phrappuccino]|uniref:Glycohydrolase n=1 Tax=Mycobacterium phage Phrappuccino TaxID=2591223 RepID=A0A514DE31_9CAUD|nr:glycohydrolase [Mycobacterium phage Phrappuccino]QDH91866.1 glycohydrolase [Mycobacterium phage Phrappuccino]QIQ63332.1 ADP-ribosyl glycohydrolase [Mycobacterium phage Settecandela]
MTIFDLAPSIQRNILLGIAYGDAWGYPNEFHSYAELTKKTPHGPDVPKKLFVSDDTQMALALAQALTYLREDTEPEVTQFLIIDEFIKWSEDKDNNRAPGHTCMSSCYNLKEGMSWERAHGVASKGCGAVMRVAPAAFLPEGLWQPVAMWQAAATHGHPAAIAASLILAAVVRRKATGGAFPEGVLAGAIELTCNIAPRGVGSDWLIDHRLAGSSRAAAAMVSFGMTLVRDKLIEAAAKLTAFRSDPWHDDPSKDLPGWYSDDALACALLCVDMVDDPVEALRRAATTEGDSDSIAAIAGAVLGADPAITWPAEWYARLEPRYRTWIDTFGKE